MKLQLFGHEYRFAVEQILLSLFPDERPEFVVSDSCLHSDDSWLAESRLTFGNKYAQATTVLRSGVGHVLRGFARVGLGRLTDELTTDRLLQRIIKQSFFRAAVNILDRPPVWGSLAGIRPAKIIEAAILSGVSKTSAIKGFMRDFHVSYDRAKLCADIAQSSVFLKRSFEPYDISLYVGIPFCPSRCAYCSFVSNSVEKSFDLIGPYVQLLLSEISETAKAVRELGFRVISVYIGGGTPTSLSLDDLETVMQALRSGFVLSDVREYTVEAGRPDTISADKLKIIKRLGADRVCVNPQSLSDDVLAAIGRKHTADDVINTARLVSDGGFCLNMDIIAGLPADSPGSFQKSLDSVLALRPENITVHTLSLKKGSRIMLEDTLIPGADDVEEMLIYAADNLISSGYSPYYLYRQKFTSGGFENIGWSLQGFEGLYNKLMMEDLGTVIGLGAGAVTKLVLPGGRIERFFNSKFPKEYTLQPGKIFDKLEKVKAVALAGK